MEERTIKSAIISTDPALRELLRKVLAADDLGITVGLEVIVPFPEINDSNLEQLRQLGPDLIFLDVSDDPIMGLKFAQFLIEGAPNRRIIGLGDPLSPELLLQACNGLSSTVHEHNLILYAELTQCLDQVLDKTWTIELAPPYFEHQTFHGSLSLLASPCYPGRPIVSSRPNITFMLCKA